MLRRVHLNGVEACSFSSRQTRRGMDVYVLYYVRQNVQIGVETGYVKRSKVMVVGNAPPFPIQC